MTVRVGAGGGERYGACLGAADDASASERLAAGPADALRRRARRALPPGVLRRTARAGAARRLRAARRRRAQRLRSGHGSLRRLAQSELTFSVRPGGVRTVFVAWPVGATAGRPRLIGRRVYAGARESLTRYWERRLAEGTVLEVPERRVMDAQRAILVQNLGLTWRYSIGNAYEQFSFPEGVDVAQVTSSYGHEDGRTIDPADVADATDAPVPELEDGPEARGLGAPLPPLPGPDVRRGGDAGPPRLRHRARPAARRERARDPPARALLVRHPRLGLRAPFAGRRLAGAALDGSRLGRDGRRGARGDVPPAGRPPWSWASRGGAGVAGAGLRTARCSFPHGCSTANGPTTT